MVNKKKGLKNGKRKGLFRGFFSREYEALKCIFCNKNLLTLRPAFLRRVNGVTGPSISFYHMK